MTSPVGVAAVTRPLEARGDWPARERVAICTLLSRLPPPPPPCHPRYGSRYPTRGTPLISKVIIIIFQRARCSPPPPSPLPPRPPALPRAALPPVLPRLPLSSGFQFSHGRYIGATRYLATAIRDRRGRRSSDEQTRGGGGLLHRSRRASTHLQPGSDARR